MISKIKARTYYKIYYTETESIIGDDHYIILYTGTKWVYIIAKKYYNKPLFKYDKKFKWDIIKHLQNSINIFNYKIEEISKEDVFLELL